MIRILLLEKNEALKKRITASLQEISCEIVTASCKTEALSLFEAMSIHLIVADSTSGGIELSAELRGSRDSTPVIILTENPIPREKRRIFRSGADGYMVLPPDLEELQLRIKNLLWRCRIAETASLRFGSCCLHAQTMTVDWEKGEIELRRMEFLLLEKLLSYPGRIFTRAQLMDELWGYDSQSDPRTVDTHIRRLRKKLRGIEDIRIQTIRGLGYRASQPGKITAPEKVWTGNALV